jgi:predicted DNA-binding protein
MSSNDLKIHITFEKTIAELLAYLAHQEHKSIAGIVRELVQKVLEIRENLYLSKLAAEIDEIGAKTYHHKNAWKQN